MLLLLGSGLGGLFIASDWTLSWHGLRFVLHLVFRLIRELIRRMEVGRCSQ